MSQGKRSQGGTPCFPGFPRGPTVVKLVVYRCQTFRNPLFSATPTCERLPALKSRPTDDRDDEIARLRSKVGELTMDNELLLQRCLADRPFAPRRRRP